MLTIRKKTKKTASKSGCSRPLEHHALVNGQCCFSLTQILLVLAVTAVCMTTIVRISAAEPDRESQIKAGFLYKFLLFTEWPETASEGTETTITIGILGKDPFGESFRPVEGKSIGGRTLAIKRFEKGAPPELLHQCRLLFISASLKDSMEEILKSLNGHPVLTVSEVDDFIRLDGMVNLLTEENRVVFEINRVAAERVGIKFRSKLLRVAVRVVED